MKTNPNPNFFEGVADYLGLARGENPWPTLSFNARELVDTSDILENQSTAIDRLYCYATCLSALKVALSTAWHIYSYIKIDGDRTIIGAVQLDPETISVTTIGRDGEDLVAYRKGEIGEALEYATRYSDFAEELLQGHGKGALCADLDSIDGIIGNVVLSESFERSKQILKECGEIIFASEEGFRPFMNFLQREWEVLSTDKSQLNKFVPLFQDSINADAMIYCIGRDIIEDVLKR